MKKTLYISLAASLLTGSVMTSCSDILEADNKTSGGQTSESFFGANPSTLLYSAFAGMRPIVNQVPIFDEGTDLYMNTRGGSPSEFGNYTISVTSGTVKDLYVNCYGVIKFANGCLKYTTPGSQDEMDAIFIRNLAYYYLTQHFGGVPYITEYIESADCMNPRANLSELYNNMIAELSAYYDKCPVSASAHDGHASKQAFAALLAKVCLAAGWDTNVTISSDVNGTYNVSGTSYFTEAASWAEKAVSGVTLYENFNDKWLPTNEASNKEEIFSIMYERTADPSGTGATDNTLCFTYGGYPTGTDASGLKYCNSQFQQNEKAIYLFEKGDTRYEGTFMTTFYDGSSLSDGYMAYYNGADPNSHKINARWFPAYMTVAECEAELNAHLSQYEGLNGANTFKATLLQAPNVTNWTIKNGALQKATQTFTAYHTQTNNGTLVKKFDDPESQYNDQCYRNIVILHASDIILVGAEANLMAGNTNSFWSKINQIRNRAGLASLSNIKDYNPLYTTPSDFGAITELDLLLDERGRELYAERTRWEDLRRTKQLVRYNKAFNSANVPNVSAVKWLRPIPAMEIEYNEAISQEDQNPGY